MPCNYVDAITRIMARIQIDNNECWLWPGERNQWGYGRIKSHRRYVVVHRVTFEHFVGPVPDGLELDHLCRVPACCNPDHLEPVTHQENIRRGRAAGHGQVLTRDESGRFKTKDAA